MRLYFQSRKISGFDFTQHRLTHQDLLNEFQHMKDWLMAKNGAWSKFEEAGCIDSLKIT